MKFLLAFLFMFCSSIAFGDELSPQQKAIPKIVSVIQCSGYEILINKSRNFDIEIMILRTYFEQNGIQITDEVEADVVKILLIVEDNFNKMSPDEKKIKHDECSYMLDHLSDYLELQII